MLEEKLDCRVFQALGRHHTSKMETFFQNTTESLTTKDFHRAEFFASVKFQKGYMNSKNVTRASANKVLSSLRVKFVFLENYLKVVIYLGNALKIETGVFLYSLQPVCYSLCSKPLKI